MAYELIKVNETHEGEVTEVILGPPPANILSAKMMGEISELLEAEARKKDKKLVIFSGEGKHFSFGASVEEHKPGNVNEMLPAFHRFIGNVINSPVPTLARVRGMCLGGAFEFVLACTFTFADSTARFGVPEIQLGVFPPVASVLLPCLTSAQFAAQAILAGEPFSADDLFCRSLITHVAREESLDEAVSVFFAKQLQPKSASSLRITHRAARMVTARQYEKFINDLENLYLDELMATADAVEGIASFLEKRKPVWKNI
jgi:cyclohexa-1,5-dienecarbonyl-CoA hydratase